MTKVDIISGFLGAGKTTLIKKLLNNALRNEQVVLIENEFGEIGIDSGFLRETGIKIREMNQGCICCSLVGDFSEALKNVITEYKPDRIIIEPSGVGKLSDVMKAIKNVITEEPITLNSYVSVVDVQKCNMYMKNFGEFYNDQIETAGCIVLSRSQDVTKEKIEEVVHMIRLLNKDARIVTTPWVEIDGRTMLNAMEAKTSLEEILLKEEHNCSHHHHDEQHHVHGEECSCSHHHHDEQHHVHGEECSCSHHHHADEVFSSWGVETSKVFKEDDLRKILKVLSSSEQYGFILRAKGMVEMEEGIWGHFDLVPGSFEIRDGIADYTGRICVIGTNINKEEIAKLFAVK